VAAQLSGDDGHKDRFTEGTQYSAGVKGDVLKILSLLPSSQFPEVHNRAVQWTDTNWHLPLKGGDSWLCAK